MLLRNKELWEKFKEHQTEMNVTKEGRRMCPMISLAFEDLHPTQMYAVMVDFVFADEFRYCFDASSNLWVPWSLIKEENCSRMYLHPETPTTGAILMKSVLTFKKLKLTNSSQTARKSKQVMLLNTMRRYFPRIHILESPDGTSFDHRLRKEFCFAETDFIAVSAYRNKQITKLKIDANPFASAYRSNGLHGQAKRRRMESSNALKKWKSTIDDDSPSNSSSVEESSNNDDETDFENAKSSADELIHAPTPVQTYNEKELNGIRAAIPFLKDRLRRDVSYFVYNGALRPERAAHSPKATENHPTAQTSNISVSKSQLTCEESTEWMWGFDEQMSMRYSPERPELEAFLPKMADNHGIATENGGKARNEQEQVSDDATKNGDGVRDAVKGTVNRRKKYLPRKLQRTRDITLVDASSTANEVRIQTQADEPTTNETKVSVSLQSQGTECNGDDKEERLHSEVTTPLNSSVVLSPCVEADDSPSSQEMFTVEDQDLPPSRLRTTTGLSVTCQDGSSLPLKESNETAQAHTTLMSISSIPENRTDSSLTALIQMCSKAGGSLSDQSYLLQSKQDQSSIPSICQVSLSQESSTASPPSPCDFLPSDVQSIKSSNNSDDDDMATLASKGKKKTSSSCTSTCSSSSDHVRSSAMLSTSLSMTTATSAVVSDSCENSLRSETFGNVLTTTDYFQATVVIEKPCLADPSHVNSIPGHVIMFTGGQLTGEKHPGYRPIAPAPNQSVDVNTVVSTTDVFQDSGYYHDNALYPIIVDSFSLNDNISYPFVQPPQVDQSYYATPDSHQTRLTGHTGFIALENTVAKQAPYLEKFYSFSAPNKQEYQVGRSQLRGSRHYRTTRTNFSRLSLVPLCSVIYPPTSCTRQITSQGKPSKESATKDATGRSQGTWGWRMG